MIHPPRRGGRAVKKRTYPFAGTRQGARMGLLIALVLVSVVGPWGTSAYAVSLSGEVPPGANQTAAGKVTSGQSDPFKALGVTNTILDEGQLFPSPHRDDSVLQDVDEPGGPIVDDLAATLHATFLSGLDPPQRLAIPSYFYPGGDDDLLWSQMEANVPIVDLAIINPNNGPGASPNPDYVTQAADSQSAGLTVLGYVYTDYGNRSIDDVLDDIKSHYDWYGVDGIFFDEASTDATGDDSKLAYYQAIYDDVKSRTGKRVVVINPGTHTDAAYLSTADIIVNFEGTYSSYTAWQPEDWERQQPAERFWHLIHTTAEADLPNAISLSKQRNAGWVYVTPDEMPNPWDTLPPDSYWRILLPAAQP